MGLCPIAPPKGFPFSIVCFCHRQQQPKTSLETFGHKHFFLFSKYLRRYPNSPIARLPGEYQEFRLFFSLQQGTLYRTCAALSSALFVRVCGGKNPQRSAALVFIGQIPHHLQANPRAVLAPEGRADHALPLDAADDAGQIE